jgi:hypothetical protein
MADQRLAARGRRLGRAGPGHRTRVLVPSEGAFVILIRLFTFFSPKTRVSPCCFELGFAQILAR